MRTELKEKVLLMNIPTRTDRRKPANVSPNTLICQIEAIAGYPSGTLGKNRARGYLSLGELREISEAIRRSSKEVQLEIRSVPR